MRMSGLTKSQQLGPWLSALAAACLTCILAHWFAARFELTPIDDAFISLRYATNWADGHGLSFNTGERVEGYTNFLLVLVEAAAVRAGAHPVLTMKVLGWASVTCLAGVVTCFIGVHVFSGRILLSIVAGVVICLNPMFCCWAFSGMESLLYTLLLFLCVTAAFGHGKFAGPQLSAGCLILAAITRPEAVVLLPVMVSVVYLRARSPRQAVRYACLFLMGFGVYFACRAVYFGYLFPNTFYAKLDYGSLFLLKRGAIYLWDFARAAVTLCVLALVSVSLIRGAPLWMKAFAMVAGMQLLTVAYQGGDHLAMFRFMVPSLPFISVLALYPCVVAANRYKPKGPGGVVLIALGLAAIGISGLTVCRDRIRNGLRTTQLEHFVAECKHARDWALMGRWLHDNAPADASLATIAIGAIGYYSGLTVVDPHGIIDPVIAHQKRTLGSGYAGHEKFDSAYVLSRRPSYLLVVHVFTPRPVASQALDLAVWGDFNRDLLQQPGLRQNYRLETVRIGSRFLNIFVRRDLPSLPCDLGLSLDLDAIQWVDAGLGRLDRNVPPVWSLESNLVLDGGRLQLVKVERFLPEARRKDGMPLAPAHLHDGDARNAIGEAQTVQQGHLCLTEHAFTHDRERVQGKRSAAHHCRPFREGFPRGDRVGGVPAVSPREGVPHLGVYMYQNIATAAAVPTEMYWTGSTRRK